MDGPHDGEGLEERFVDLEYCFLGGDEDGPTYNVPVVLDGFQLSFFDFDQASAHTCLRPPIFNSLTPSAALGCRRR